MRLIDHVGFDLAGRGSLSQNNPQADALWLTQTYGSGRAASRATGIPESTLRGWRKGVQPQGRAKEMLEEAARAAAVETNSGHYYDAFDGTLELSIRGSFTVSNDTRVRTVYPGRYIPLGDIQAVLDLWSLGDDDQAEARLIAAIDEWYHPLQYDHVYWARFV